MAQLLEVEPLRLIIVCGDGLRVAIDDYGLVTQRSQALDARDGAPVKLHAAADAVWPTTQDDDARLGRGSELVLPGKGLIDHVRRRHAIQWRKRRLSLSNVGAAFQVNVALHAAVGEVEVVRLCGELRRQGINLFDDGKDLEALAQEPHVLLLHTATLVDLRAHVAGCRHSLGGRRHRRCLARPQLQGNLAVSKAATLGLRKDGLAPAELKVVHRLERLLHAVDVVQLRQEPAVNAGKIVDLLHAHAQLKGLCDRPDPHGRRLLQLGRDRLCRARVGPAVLQLQVKPLGVEASAALVHHAQGLLNCLLEGATNGHDLANALHRGANGLVHSGELAQVPARHLGHHVVKRGLEASSGAEGHAVPQLDEVVAQSELRCHVRQGVASSL
mmetsp:Transcript_71241/g.189432  ORF Transcript_71241/g.189432 Transcript_71241/m.189432 type:complete len:386 (-) Transcript_71241:2267-3424(-)